jgi:hypothetical protein
MSARPKSAARARKRRQLYLSDVLDADGNLVGWRFNPGPGLRAAGVKSALLKRADGSWMSEAEARMHRDRVLTAARTGAPAPTLAPPALAQRRTLQHLFDLFVAAEQKRIDDGDEDAIAPRTLAFYRTMIKPWLAWGGDELAAALDAEIVEEQYKAQRRAGRSHTSAHAGLRALMAVLAHGKRLKWFAENPALQLGLARPAGRLRLIAPEEAEALVAAADAIGERAVGDAIVAALWTGQRLDDLLGCHLDLQLRDGVLIFARTHEDDFSQAKTGGQAQVLVLPPLAERLGKRRAGWLIEPDVRRQRKTNALRWTPKNFNTRFRAVRAAAVAGDAAAGRKPCPSCADIEFRDTRDTAVTRLHLAKTDVASIALWTGHSMKSIQDILAKHYLVSTRDAALQAGEQFEQWRQRAGVKW